MILAWALVSGHHAIWMTYAIHIQCGDVWEAWVPLAPLDRRAGPAAVPVDRTMVLTT
jgi:hypothetical protein